MSAHKPKIQVFEWETLEDDPDQFGYRIVAGNGQIMTSGQGYRDRTDAKRGAVDFLEAVQILTTHDIEHVDSLGNSVDGPKGERKSVTPKKAAAPRKAPAKKAAARKR